MQTRSIELTTPQLAEAADVARRLHDGLRSRGVRNAHGLRDADATREMEVTGAAAELAASLMLGVEWTASRPDHHVNGPDIGTRTQIRSSNVQRRRHHLIVRGRDIQKYGDVPFVLVIRTGCVFTILGWMMAFEARQKGHLWDGGDSGRPRAWFVAQEKLHPIDTLRGV